MFIYFQTSDQLKSWKSNKTPTIVNTFINTSDGFCILPASLIIAFVIDYKLGSAIAGAACFSGFSFFSFGCYTGTLDYEAKSAGFSTLTTFLTESSFFTSSFSALISGCAFLEALTTAGESFSEGAWFPFSTGASGFSFWGLDYMAGSTTDSINF